MKRLFWIILLKKWCQKQSGLTLPFLVAATARHESAPANLSLAADIIHQIKTNDQKDTYFKIQECGLTHFPVICICHREGETGYKFFLGDNWGETEDEQVQKYLTHSEKAIKSGHISRVPDYPNFSWSENFTEKEEQFIDSLSGCS